MGLTEEIVGMSSSMMVAVACARLNVTLTGLLRFRKNVSLGSLSESTLIVTATVCVVAPGWKCAVPETAT